MSGVGLVVLGSVNVDTTLSVPSLPQAGETLIASGLRRSFGGKGLNQAVAAARAGAATTLVAAVGNDEQGAAIRDLLRAEGIADAGLRTVERPTGNAVVLVDERGENTIIVAPLANHALVEVGAATAALIGSCAVLLCQLEVPVPTVTVALRHAHAAGALTVLNAAPATALPKEMRGNIDVLVVNRGEAAVVARGMAGGAASSSDLDRLLSLAPEVIVTVGADGADYANRQGVREHVSAPQVAARDSTGAGDAFCGALCAALGAGRSTVDGLRLAVAAGARAVEHPGAFPPSESRSGPAENRLSAAG